MHENTVTAAIIEEMRVRECGHATFLAGDMLQETKLNWEHVT